MNRLEVKTSRLQFILVILLGFFFVPLSLSNLINGLWKGFAPVSVGLGLIMLIAYGSVVWLVRRGNARSVKYFSDVGLVRNDGQSFAWTDLSGVINQIKINPPGRNTKFLWRIEIQFKNGEAAWLIPTKITNFREVRDFVDRLPCKHTEVRV